MSRAKQEPKNKKISSAAIAAVIAAVVICICIFGVYPAVTERIIEVSQKSMDELAEHDERSLEANINQKWELLDSIANQIRQNKSASVNELLLCVSSGSQFIECLRLTLIDTEGGTVSSDMTISNVEKDEMLLSAPEQRRYIYCAENRNGETESQRESLVIGERIMPFEVEGHVYTHIAAIMDIDTFENVMKTDIYGGRGFSRVIDADGRYIINQSIKYMSRGDGFFARLRAGELKDGFSEEIVREKMKNGETFSFSFRPENDELYFLSLIPLRRTGWYFIMGVPLAVYMEQSASLLWIFLFMIILLVAAIAAVVFVILQRRSHLLEVEQKHREALSDALVLAEQASRAKTSFLNNMSHDIRTPMNAIIGFTALATAHAGSNELLRDYLSKITQSSNHLLSLINDVLDMSRIESGNLNLNEKPESLSEILQTLRDITQSDVRAKRLHFFIDSDGVSNKSVYCDKLRLNQILLNLVSNAIKFTPSGGTVSVRVEQTSVTKTGLGTYQIKVKDNGIGMSESFAATIFEPFTRERNSTVSGIQGTGLGMSITKSIVDMMGGTITVESREGEGTEFTVNLSFRLCESDRTAGGARKLEGLRGLVADGDADSCQSTAQILQQIGVRADLVFSGEEAVACAEKAVQDGDPYEFYVVNRSLPDLNGIETARRIRKAAGRGDPAVILSAREWTDVEEEAREAGVTEFLSSPVSPSELYELLLKLTDREQGADAENAGIEKLAGKRLLLTEDNELNREIAAEILKSAGFVVECAENGQKAVEMLGASEPGYYSAVLMDIQMPVMDGYEASRTIRKLSNPTLAGIPIIAMTANAFEQDKQLALEAGMNAHVSKPIDVKVLLDTILKIVR